MLVGVEFLTRKPATDFVAAIQGRDCLIQKFRNSSVMLEPPHYRPKVSYLSDRCKNILIKNQLFLTFHDGTGRAGQEDEFPASDNAAKLKRSCENAEHVGKCLKFIRLVRNLT